MVQMLAGISDLVGKLKTAFVGDLSQYDCARYQGVISENSHTLTRPMTNVGRTYSLLEVSAPKPKRKSRTVQILTGMWSAVRRVGEYDVVRTR